MAGTASTQVRNCFDVETVAGTTNTSPTLKTVHVPVMWEGGMTRFHQKSQVAGGANYGDALLSKVAKGKLSGPIVYGVYDPLIESLLQSTFSSDVLLDGKGRQTATFEQSFPAGIGGTTTYLRHKGVEAVGAVLRGNAAGEIQFEMDLLGMQSIDSATSALSGATYTDPSNKDPLSSNTDFGTLTFAGFTLDEMQSIVINLAYDGRDPQPKMGGDVLAGITRGAFVPTIDAVFYIGSNFAALRDAARASSQTPAKLTVNLGSVTLKKYKFEFWTCYADFTENDWSQPTAFLKVKLTPAYSSSAGGVLTITRAIV